MWSKSLSRLDRCLTGILGNKQRRSVLGTCRRTGEGLVGKVCGINKASQNGPCAAESQATVAHKYHSTENDFDF